MYSAYNFIWVDLLAGHLKRGDDNHPDQRASHPHVCKPPPHGPEWNPLPAIDVGLIGSSGQVNRRRRPQSEKEDKNVRGGSGMDADRRRKRDAKGVVAPDEGNEICGNIMLHSMGGRGCLVMCSDG